VSGTHKLSSTDEGTSQDRNEKVREEHSQSGVAEMEVQVRTLKDSERRELTSWRVHRETSQDTKRKRARERGALTDCRVAERTKSAQRKKASEGRSRPAEYGGRTSKKVRTAKEKWARGTHIL